MCLQKPLSASRVKIFNQKTHSCKVKEKVQCFHINQLHNSSPPWCNLAHTLKIKWKCYSQPYAVKRSPSLNNLLTLLSKHTRLVYLTQKSCTWSTLKGAHHRLMKVCGKQKTWVSSWVLFSGHQIPALWARASETVADPKRWEWDSIKPEWSAFSVNKIKVNTFSDTP